jgi:hypothetical protein
VVNEYSQEPANSASPAAFPVTTDRADAAGAAPLGDVPTRSELLKLQLGHPLTRRILEHLTSGGSGEECDAEEAAELGRLAAQHELAYDGVLLWRGDDGKRRLVLPPQLKQHAFRMYHDRLGHLGLGRAFPLLYERYYWGLAKQDARGEFSRYIGNCPACTHSKIPHHGAGEGHLVEHGMHIYDIVSVDSTKVGFTSPNGYDTLTTWGCNLSRHVTCCPSCGDPDSREIVRQLVWFVIRVYGTPSVVRSDNASVFTSAAVKFIYARYGIRIRASTSYHHQTVGLIERFHSTLKSLLLTRRAAVKGDDAWEDYLPLLELAFNTTVNTALGMPPAFVVHGRHLKMPADVLIEPVDAPAHLSATDREWVTDRITHGRAAVTEAFRVLERNALASKKRHDLKHDVNISYAVGQRVILVKGSYIDKNIPKAEQPTEDTVYTVSRVLEQGNYELQTPAGRKLKNPVNVARMLPAHTPRDFTAERGAAEYPVECIVDRRVRDRTTGPLRGPQIIEYRVKWVGYGRNYGNYWYPAEMLSSITELVAAYNARFPLPADHLPAALPSDAPAASGARQPLPTAEARERRHMRRRAEPGPTTVSNEGGGAAAEPATEPDDAPTTPPSTADIFPAGSLIEVRYSSGHGGARWWRGTVTRTFVSRPRRGGDADRVIEVRFDAAEYSRLYTFPLRQYEVRGAHFTRRQG